MGSTYVQRTQPARWSRGLYLGLVGLVHIVLSLCCSVHVSVHLHEREHKHHARSLPSRGTTLRTQSFLFVLESCAPFLSIVQVILCANAVKSSYTWQGVVAASLAASLPLSLFVVATGRSGCPLGRLFFWVSPRSGSELESANFA